MPSPACISGHGQCQTHRRYDLTCAEIGELVEITGNRCQLCEATSDGKRWRMLFIDHDHSLGYWAVRGLLCSSCNTFIGGARKSEAIFPARPWHEVLMERAGRPKHMPQPQVGGTVVSASNGHVYWRGMDRWHRMNGVYQNMRYSWLGLTKRYSPRRLTIAPWINLADVPSPRKVLRLLG